MTEPQLQPVEALTDPKKMVAIVAHHDDIEFGCAGSISKWIEEGADVTYVIIRDGSAGSNEPGVIREELAAQRKKEQLAAADAVGVTDVRVLGYQDGHLQPTMELRKELTRILREVKPFRVILQDPSTYFFGDGYINHPDHRAAGEAALYAVFPSTETRPIFSDLLDEGYEPHKVSELFMNLSLNPTHFVDITSVFEKKKASLRAHVSQLGEGEGFENGAMKFIEERNAAAGEKFGVGYAEAFKVMILQSANENVREQDMEVPENIAE